jgi:hypothetical protein
MFIEPIGDASAVTMDSHAPYVGAQSLTIREEMSPGSARV